VEYRKRIHIKKWLWNFTDNHISAKFEYEWHDNEAKWYRSYRNEQWEFTDNGQMQRREASINDVPIAASDRRL
jgi:nuclear transport factor 2 (NTF2) superfamily protein